jgi:ABC-type bacteriocin/lantibiotic exporter with double-glycine peptidase domain
MVPRKTMKTSNETKDITAKLLRYQQIRLAFENLFLLVIISVFLFITAIIVLSNISWQKVILLLIFSLTSVAILVVQYFTLQYFRGRSNG